jgi:hypothetical protein
VTKAPDSSARGGRDGKNEGGHIMDNYYNLSGTVENRKELVKRLEELTGLKAVYTYMPRYAYEIGAFTVERNGDLTVGEGADESIIDTLLAEQMIVPVSDDEEPDDTDEEDDDEYDEETDDDEDEDYDDDDAEDDDDDTDEDEDDDPESGIPVNTSICVPITGHTVQSLLNLICMIHSRGPLLSKSTDGEFSADKTLIDALGSTTFRDIHELIAYIREWDETNPPLTGITLDSETITFDGFGEAPDADYVQTYMRLAAAMNQMALTQKRVQAKDVDDSNEKYAFRIWAIRLGLNGPEYKDDRKRLLANLSGHVAFRNDAERERWEAKQKAKREALKNAENDEEEDSDAATE